ncbi:MAG: glycoside hydrolase family 3 protein, partial [Bacilli bacterium]
MKIDNLTLEEKVGQMLMFAFNGTTYNKQIDTFINEFKLGGVIYFKKNIENIHQTAFLNKQISEKASIPLFKAIDQEGGPVLRFTEEVTPLPGAMALAAANADIYEICKRVGLDLKKIGFNMNFAPVGDINNNPLNPVINSRAYSDKVEIVENCVVQAFKGFQKAKLLSTIKHFPGHGDTSVDSHIGLPVVDKSLEDILELELKPFKKAFYEGIDGVMVSHMLYKQIDNKYPSTLSRKIITNLLKDKLGFKGLIVTDSLTMGAIWKKFSIEEIIKLGINAGNDILCFCGKALIEEQREIVNTFIKLVNSNEISMDRINESVQ